jgi:hypothetical protein
MPASRKAPFRLCLLTALCVFAFILGPFSGFGQLLSASADAISQTGKDIGHLMDWNATPSGQSSLTPVSISVNIPWVSGGAEADYGTNHVFESITGPAYVQYNSDGTTNVLTGPSEAVFTSGWSDRFTVTGSPYPSGPIIFLTKFEILDPGPSHPQYTLNAIINGTNVAVPAAGTWSLQLRYVENEPFDFAVELATMDGVSENSGYIKHSDLRTSLIGILAPEGTILASASGHEYPLLNPSLEIYPGAEGSTLYLHWFGFPGQTFLETTVDLVGTDPARWTEVDISTATITSMIEHTFEAPLEPGAHYFRLKTVLE